MENYILKNDYIENKEQVMEILKSKRFYIKYIDKSKMNDFDNYDMYKYKLTINDTEFDYFEGLGLDLLDNENIKEKIINGLSCLLSDSVAFINSKDLEDFMLDYGYEDMENARKIYNGCKITYEKLKKVFNDEEISILMESINL